MKTFLRKIILFTSIFITILILFEITTSTIISTHADFKFKSNPKYVILGPSVATFAYNDSIIDSLKNLTSPGESYFYTLQKIDPILEQNTSVETIFIEFSNASIDKEKMSDKIWEDDIMNFNFPNLSIFMTVDDHLLLLKNNFVAYLKVSGISSFKKLERILKNDHDFSNVIGRYRHLNRNKTDSIVRTINYEKVELLNINLDYELATYNLMYLDKLIKACTKHNKRVILLRTPQHYLYPLKNNEKKFQDILKNRYSDVEFLDLSTFKLRNKEFADLEHLNYRGAKRFSIWFNKLIKSGLLAEKIDQSAVNRKIVLENSLNGFRDPSQCN